MFARKRLKDSDRTILTQKQEGFGFSDYAFRGRSGEREFVIPSVLNVKSLSQETP